MPQPPEDVCDELDTQVFQSLTFTAGTNLFAHEPRTEVNYPVPCIFVWEGAGFAPEECFNATSGTRFNPTVFVRIRCPNENMQLGRLIARDVRDFLHKRDITGYISFVSLNSGPLPEGENRASQHEFSLTFQGAYRV